MARTAAVVVVLLLSRVIKAQLQVQIRKYSQISSELGENFTVQAEYIFPSGFSGDWFVTSHANIPAEGITGLLCQPQPEEDCHPFNSSTQNHCHSGDNVNLPRIIILEDLDSYCTEEQVTHFDALITYSPDDAARDINRYQTPLAIVSKEFYFTLQDSIDNDCLDEISTLVNLSVGDTDVIAVRIALVTFIMLCGLLFMCSLIILLFLAVMCCRKCLKGRGNYNVHENQLHELGPVEGTRHGTFRGTLTLPYTPQERHFCSGDSNSQCAICLEEFVDGEVTSVLACSTSHAFHPNCINKWLESQSTCPVCRTMMSNTWL